MKSHEILKSCVQGLIASVAVGVIFSPSAFAANQASEAIDSTAKAPLLSAKTMSQGDDTENADSVRAGGNGGLFLGNGGDGGDDEELE